MPRTTINIPADLLQAAKIEAATRNIPLQQVVSEAIELKYRRFPTTNYKKLTLKTGQLTPTSSTYRRQDIYAPILKHRTGH